MNRSLLLAALAVVVLGGGTAGFYIYRDAAAVRDRTAKLVAEAKVETSADKFDRSSASRLLSRVKTSLDTFDGSPPADLVRVRCRLEFALHRYSDAWDTIVGLALAPAADPVDLELGGLVQMRLFEIKGAQGGPEALGLAVSHYRATQNPRSLFRAWQLAYRSAAVDSWLEFQAELSEKFGDLPEGEFARVAGYDIALLIARRLGVVDADIEKVASSSVGDDLQRLCASILAAESTGKALRAGALVQQARAWDSIPPEMQVLIATRMVSDGTPSEEDIHDALDRVQLALEQDPANVDARHAIAILMLQVGDKAGSADHLRWLQNKSATKGDSRRPMWGRMLKLTR